ncbi:MAG: hypothetical protein KIS94_12200 [Chitinophagales bacterium]|nr:hypothetical protein [Chitinophagales bacterium]
MNRKTTILLVALLLTSVAFISQSCKSCKKEKESEATTSDSTALPGNLNVNTIDAPHGDTSLIPILADVLTKTFEAAQKKDYAAFGSYIVYRGPDDNRHGYDVFNVKNNYEKNIVKITADVFTKWSGAEAMDYTRVFELPQPDGRTLTVLEVIMVYPKKVDRKFFGFLLINNEFKIADVTSYL